MGSAAFSAQVLCCCGFGALRGILRDGSGLTVVLSGKDCGRCPSCGTRSISRHSGYSRHFGDLPAHGVPVTAVMTITRRLCRNPQSSQRIFCWGRSVVGSPRRAANQSDGGSYPSILPWRRWEAFRADHGSSANAGLPYLDPSPTQVEREKVPNRAHVRVVGKPDTSTGVGPVSMRMVPVSVLRRLANRRQRGCNSSLKRHRGTPN